MIRHIVVPEEEKTYLLDETVSRYKSDTFVRVDAMIKTTNPPGMHIVSFNTPAMTVGPNQCSIVDTKAFYLRQTIARRMLEAPTLQREG